MERHIDHPIHMMEPGRPHCYEPQHKDQTGERQSIPPQRAPQADRDRRKEGQDQNEYPQEEPDLHRAPGFIPALKLRHATGGISQQGLQVQLFVDRQEQ
ncbi:hypothetical protein [Sulfitobacter indolifex]|uniref:hypothetical protein n=1 Tax=Sulfitobacter indolifex TaxID=225422 RepID=UPI001FACD3E4|nr:hypothetical protein [Sulfitobacter indolifex]